MPLAARHRAAALRLRNTDLYHTIRHFVSSQNLFLIFLAEHCEKKTVNFFVSVPFRMIFIAF